MIEDGPIDGKVLNELVHAPEVWMESTKEELQSQMGDLAEISVMESLFPNCMGAFVETEHIVQVCREVSEEKSDKDRVLCVMDGEYGEVY